MHSLGIVQWDSTRRDHPGYPGRVSGMGLINLGRPFSSFLYSCHLWHMSTCYMLLSSYRNRFTAPETASKNMPTPTISEFYEIRRAS